MKKLKKNYLKIKRRFIKLFDRLLINIDKPEMRILPGQLAFFFFMALIPLAAIVGSFISLFNLPYSSLSDLLRTYFPAGTANLLVALSSNVGFNFNFVIFFISATFLASNGTYSMIISSDEIYKIRYKGYIADRLKAFLMMLVVLVLLLFILVIPVFGDTLFNYIKLTGMNPVIIKSLYLFYKIIKYPLSFLFIYFLIKTLYIMAPDKKISRNNVTYGAIFTSFSWIFLTQLYSIYVERFNNYTTFYGNVASILILMLWLYLLCYIFVLGMALNFTKYEMINAKKQ